ncbi:MAG: hypothetical protein OXK80_06100 [Bdellovibrionales bacterium]|nr:hypothetical protein [Bdellovibrionales bacterium]
MIFKSLITISIIFSTQLSYSQEFHFGENLIQDLKDKGELGLLDEPMIYAFEQVCAGTDATSMEMSLEGICSTIVQSDFCQKIENKEDLMDCTKLKQDTPLDPLEMIIDCGDNIWNSIVDFFKFIWDFLVNAVEIPEQFMEYAESVKLYLVSEYDKAYDEAKNFKRLNAVKTVASKIGVMIWQGLQQMLSEQYQEFGCLSGAGKINKVCALIGTFAGPFAILKAMKIGIGAARTISGSQKASRKVRRKSKRSGVATRKAVKESKALLSQYKKEGKIKQGVVQVQYIDRRGNSWTADIINADQKYVYARRYYHKVRGETLFSTGNPKPNVYISWYDPINVHDTIKIPIEQVYRTSISTNAEKIIKVNEKISEYLKKGPLKKQKIRVTFERPNNGGEGSGKLVAVEKHDVGVQIRYMFGDTDVERVPKSSLTDIQEKGSFLWDEAWKKVKYRD